MKPQTQVITGGSTSRSPGFRAMRGIVMVLGFGLVTGGLWLLAGCAPSTAETSSSDTLFDRAKNNPMEYMPNLDNHDIDGESKLGRDADHVFNPDQPFGR